MHYRWSKDIDLSNKVADIVENMGMFLLLRNLPQITTNHPLTTARYSRSCSLVRMA